MRTVYPTPPAENEPPPLVRLQGIYNHPELFNKWTGFTGRAKLFDLAETGFDMIQDWPLDAMHNVFLGIVKAKMVVWFSQVLGDLGTLIGKTKRPNLG